MENVFALQCMSYDDMIAVLEEGLSNRRTVRSPTIPFLFADACNDKFIIVFIIIIIFIIQILLMNEFYDYLYSTHVHLNSLPY